MNLQGRWSPTDLACALKAALLGSPREAEAAYVRELLSTGGEWEPLQRFDVRDRREEIRTPKLKRGRPRGTRTWDEITGICLHQTASPVGHDHPKLLAVPAHAHISQEGIITLLQPATAYMWHGHALNSFTIGIELEARAAGVEGDPSTFWRSKAEKRGWYRTKTGRKVHTGIKTYDDLVREATDTQLRSLDALIRYYIRLHRRNASPAVVSHLKVPVYPTLGLYAHRQGHKSRTSDPGSRIASHVWSEFILPDGPSLPVKEWLRDTTGEKYGGGRPWLKEWLR